MCGVLTETLNTGPIVVGALAASFAALGIGFCLIREYFVSFSRRIVHALFHFYALLMLLLLFFKSISDQTPTFLSDLLLLFTPSRRSVLLQALEYSEYHPSAQSPVDSALSPTGLQLSGTIISIFCTCPSWYHQIVSANSDLAWWIRDFSRN